MLEIRVHGSFQDTNANMLILIGVAPKRIAWLGITVQWCGSNDSLPSWTIYIDMQCLSTLKCVLPRHYNVPNAAMHMMLQCARCCNAHDVAAYTTLQCGWSSCAHDVAMCTSARRCNALDVVMCTTSQCVWCYNVPMCSESPSDIFSKQVHTVLARDMCFLAYSDQTLVKCITDVCAVELVN